MKSWPFFLFYLLIFKKGSCKTLSSCGWLAQLVEHLVYTEGVSGSNPLPPTIFSLKHKEGTPVLIRGWSEALGFDLSDKVINDRVINDVAFFCVILTSINVWVIIDFNDVWFVIV